MWSTLPPPLSLRAVHTCAVRGSQCISRAWLSWNRGLPEALCLEAGKSSAERQVARHGICSCQYTRSTDAALKLTSFNFQGGGLVFGDGLQDEYGDWVGHDQKFIAVNMNYRLGMLGFMNHPDLPSANAGLLDQRMAMRWVKQNIAAFGGDPDNITIISQSGGGWAIAAQLGLYDGQANGTFQRAIARSIQREPLFTTKELMLRNTVLSEQLNCTSADQLACFRSVSVPDLVDIFQNMSIANGTEWYMLFQGPFLSGY